VKSGSRVAFLLALAACAPGRDRGASPGSRELWDEIQERKVLRVAMVLQFPPQFYRDRQTREPAGYDVEMLKMMAKDLGVELHIEDMDFTASIPALLAGKADLISNGLVNTPERAKLLHFSEPYVPYQHVLIVQKGARVGSHEALNQPGKVVSVLLGSTSHELAKLLFPKAEIRALERQDTCFLEVSSKKADAALVEQYLAIPYVRNNPQTTELLNPEKPFSLQYGCLAVGYGNPRFVYWLDNWIRFYKANGVLDSLYERIIGPSLTFSAGGAR